MANICHNCFTEYEGSGLCPNCGFDAVAIGVGVFFVAAGEKMKPPL